MIAPLLQAYAAAARTKDVDAFMRLYADDVRVFDAWGVWSYEGAPAWRKMIETWFGSLGDEGVRVAFDDVVTTLAPGFAHLTAIVTYAGVSASDETLRSMQNRLTWVLRDGSAGWQVIHEHTSLPVGFDDAKAILHRDAGA
jgi:ketosteroid isomerase-like protein